MGLFVCLFYGYLVELFGGVFACVWFLCVLVEVLRVCFALACLVFC